MFYFFAAILLFAALRVITARNPVHAALFLVLAFFTAAGIWMLLQAEFLAIALVLVYVGAVMVLFLFVVMMLDINLDSLREGFWNYLPLGAAVGVLMAVEMALVLGGKLLRPGRICRRRPTRGRLQQHQGTGPAAVYRLRLSVRNRRGDSAGGHRRGDRADPAPAQGQQAPSIPAEQVAVKRNDRVRIVSDAVGKGRTDRAARASETSCMTVGRCRTT